MSCPHCGHEHRDIECGRRRWNLRRCRCVVWETSKPFTLERSRWGYHATFPYLPGCEAWGDTPAEAFQHLRQARALYWCAQRSKDELYMSFRLMARQDVRFL